MSIFGHSFERSLHQLHSLPVLIHNTMLYFISNGLFVMGYHLTSVYAAVLVVLAVNMHEVRTVILTIFRVFYPSKVIVCL